MEVMVSYKVKADRAGENERYVKEVFAQLQREQPEGIRYATFKLGDGVSFVHIASIHTPDGSNPLLALDTFREFVRNIRDRCDEFPVTSAIENIGSYRAFAG